MASALSKEIGQSVPEARASEDRAPVTNQPEGSLGHPTRRQIASKRVIPTHLDEREHIARSITVPIVTFRRELLRQGSEVVTKTFGRMN
jgi:hypothetical protein